MTTTDVPTLAARLRALWALGDYATVADTVIPGLGARLVEASGIGPGDRVLDVAAGSGNAALPAARAGARVTASDITPELLEAGRAVAERQGLDLVWREADAEALPFDDDAFDATISCVGVMFAPHHQESADELVRVTRPGGTIGLASWTPEGFIGRMFGVMKPYAPAPPPGAQPPPLWGSEDHVRRLFGDRVEDVTARRETVDVDCFDDAAAFRDFFKAHYGPTIAVYHSLAEQPERARELDHALLDLAAEADLGGGRMEWEYLLITARVP